MIANTHRMVGEFLYQQLSPSNQAFIHKRRFVYGNIKPDIHQKYLRMSHYHRDNEEIIFDNEDSACDYFYHRIKEINSTSYRTWST